VCGTEATWLFSSRRLNSLPGLDQQRYRKQRNFVQANVHQYPGRNTKLCDLQPGSTKKFEIVHHWRLDSNTGSRFSTMTEKIVFR
jgi:hypothetical protein